MGHVCSNCGIITTFANMTQDTKPLNPGRLLVAIHPEDSHTMKAVAVHIDKTLRNHGIRASVVFPIPDDEQAPGLLTALFNASKVIKALVCKVPDLSTADIVLDIATAHVLTTIEALTGAHQVEDVPTLKDVVSPDEKSN